MLLDGPALTSGALATSICKAADGTVMVMEPSGISAATLAGSRRLLASARVQLLGVVINQKVPETPFGAGAANPIDEKFNQEVKLDSVPVPVAREIPPPRRRELSSLSRPTMDFEGRR